MNIDIATREAVTSNINAAINQHCVQPPRYARFIKPSSIGDECVARSWYAWRWAKRPSFDGQKTRQFERGNIEEKLFIEKLSMAGFNVDAIDPERVKAGKRNTQYKIGGLSGHMKGFIDGKLMHPQYTFGMWVLTEVKSMNNRRWGGFKRKGVIASDEKYAAQIMISLELTKLPWCLFFALNADTGELYTEIVEYSETVANITYVKARTVKEARQRPARKSDSAAWFGCKSCDYADICHRKAPVDVNCRSCINAVPNETGGWNCEKWGKEIPFDFLLKACPQYEPIK